MKAIYFTDEAKWQEEWQRIQLIPKKRCTRCLYDETTPTITFDVNGVCHYCHTHDQLDAQYQSPEGRATLERIIEKIRYEGRKKPYDVIVGVSGGCDSSFLVHFAKEKGLRPLAVHYDNTWNSTIAVENIFNVLDKLNVELWTHVVDNHEYDDLYKSILQCGTADLEAPTDLALASTLNMAAEKYRIKYIFEGHSFKTEGLSPLGWLYMDAKYIHSMHKKFGKIKNLKTYPHLWLGKQMKWMLLNRLKKIRPLWYIDYNKEDVKKMLTQEFDWKWYGGHHLENRMTNFYHSYFLPRRFGIDQRINGYAALVRSGQMEREEGLAHLKIPPGSQPDLIDMIKKRWELDDQTFVDLMTLPRKTYKDFKSYKSTFENLRPFFYCMAKLNLIPMSFYMKYTLKDTTKG
ncbi:MAG: N-acetyl sugar amidotransferase [Gammaproteobacteria bacterium]|nr:N-acetyl sugar amidotransferase [Gammaproteobacteria bacterium]